MLAWIYAALRRLLQALGLAKRREAAPPTGAEAGVGAGPKPLDSGFAVPKLGGQAPFPPSPTLAMPELVATDGAFPSHDGIGTTAAFTLGMVQIFAENTPAFGAPRAAGQALPVNQNQALFSVLGMTFGGGFPTTFALPNLNGRTAVGGAPVGQSGQSSLTLTYMIAPYASASAPLPGMVVLFAAGWAPDGWLVADGSLLPISRNVALFEVIGTTFGGNPAAFNLPNLNGAAVVGVGDAPGLPAVALGQQVGGSIPRLGLNYLIATDGVFPTTEGDGAFPQNLPFVGQVIAYAGAQVPEGWAMCDGSLVAIEDNTNLFELIGTTYGGDGQTNFALPDLRGRMIVGLSG